MRDDFETAADFLILNAPTIRSQQNDQRISALEQGDGDTQTLSELSHVKVKDRFYSPEEYGTLNKDQKAKLRLLQLVTKKVTNLGIAKQKGKIKSASRIISVFKPKTIKQRIAALESVANNPPQISKAVTEST